MKKLLSGSAVLALGLLLATPAMAGHHGHYRGHAPRVVHGAFLGIGAVPFPHFFAPPRISSSVSFSFGFPYYTYPRYYAPAPVYYAPAPVFAAPAPCEPVWIPAHYVWDDGAQFYVSGHWSH